MVLNLLRIKDTKKKFKSLKAFAEWNAFANLKKISLSKKNLSALCVKNKCKAN